MDLAPFRALDLIAQIMVPTRESLERASDIPIINSALLNRLAEIMCLLRQRASFSRIAGGGVVGAARPVAGIILHRQGSALQSVSRAR